MAALDFPPSPTVGQKHPTTPVIGQPVYTWDGEKWTTIGGLIGDTGAATELPLMDGIADVGVSLKWTREDHVHPTDTSRAAVTDVTASLDTKVDVAGDTMTGDLTITKPNPALILDKTADTQDVILRGRKNGLERWAFDFGNNTAESGSNVGSDFILYAYDDAGAYLNTPMKATRSTGLMTVKSDPTDALGIATKAYVDRFRPNLIPMAGNTSFDIPVPATATMGRLSGTVFLSSATGVRILFQIGLDGGGFKTAVGDYQCSGFYHLTNVNPNGVSFINGDASRTGMLITNFADNINWPIQFEARLMLKRAANSRFTCLSRGFGADALNGGISNLFTNITSAAATGTATRITSLRIIADAGSAWGAESCVVVDWI